MKWLLIVGFISRAAGGFLNPSLHSITDMKPIAAYETQEQCEAARKMLDYSPAVCIQGEPILIERKP